MANTRAGTRSTGAGRQPGRHAAGKAAGPTSTVRSLWPWTAPTPGARQLAGWALLPLRAFLGATFVFAGLQKLANPAFFDGSNPASIQAQLHGALRRSPIHLLLAPFMHVAVPLGVAIALAELAVGLGTLLGLWARVAAGGGALLSFFLFLTVSFHSSPYYTGSDIVFVFAWLPFVVTGAGPLSLDAASDHMVRRRMGAAPQAVVAVPFTTIRRVCGSYEEGRCTARRGAPCEPAPCPYLRARPEAVPRLDVRELDRRTVAAQGALAGVVALGALVSGGAAAALGRLAGGGSAKGAVRQLGASPAGSTTAPPAPSTPSTTAGPPDSTTAPSTAPPSTTTTVPTRPAGVKIGPAADVPVGGAASFTDPRSGDPSLVVQPQAGTFLAFDAVCPHAGCTVEYDPNNRLFICPCHGSEFNGRTGGVIVGPAVSGLSKIGIAEGSDGQLYVT